MPPISRPPPTCRRLAVTSAQPASTLLSNDRLHHVLSVLWVLFIVSWVIVSFIVILLMVIVSLRYHEPNSLPSVAAQLASPPLSHDTVDYGPVGTPIAVAGECVSFLMIFLLFLIVILLRVIDDPMPPDFRRGAPLQAPHGRPPLRAPCGLDPAIIKTFPIVLYTAVKGHKISEVPLECAVCLSRFKDDSKLQVIPKCDHAFHPNCIAKWFASHATCPVCRTNLASQLVVHSASQLSEASTEPPWVEVEVKVEASTPDGGAPERIPQEDGQEQVQPPDLWDKIESGSFDDRNRTHGSGRIPEFPRSHSTGHSLTRPGEDAERFTLRLPALVRKQMIDRPGPVLPLEGCSRQGYLRGGEASSPGSYYFTSPPRLDLAAKSETWDFKRILSTVAADGGEGSSRGSVPQSRPAIID